MKYITTLRLRSLLAVAAVPALVLFGPGCRGTSPASQFSDRADQITGVENAIVFRTVGEPLDAVENAATTISLDEAVRLTLRHDPSIQMALARVRSALADAKQARLLPNPILNVAFRFPESGGPVNVEASLSADLLSLLQTPRRISAADHRLRAATADALVAVLNAIAAVEERHAAVRALDAEVAVLDDRLRLVKRLLDLTQSRVEAGEAARLDSLVLDAERIAVETEQIETASRRRQQRLALARLIGQPSGDVDWALPPWVPTPPLVAPEATLVGLALENRPEAMSARWQLAALGDTAALSRWGWLEGSQVGVDAERDSVWSVGPGVSVPIPLFDWGQARRDKADAQVVEARHRLTEVHRSVVEDVRQARTSQEAARAALAKVRDELIPVARRRHDQAESQYRAGEADITALLQAEQQLLGAKSRLVQAEQAVAVANVRLHRALGGRAVASHATGSTTTRPTATATSPMSVRFEKEQFQ